MARFGSLDTQYFDDAGDPLVNGRVYFYESGTTTLKNTYADVNYAIPNTNPVILTAAGRQPNIFFEGVAKAVLTTSSGVQILVRDPVGDTASTFGNAWIASKDYNANDVVQGSDGEFYVSLINGNVNNDPVTTSGYWTFLYSVEWNQGTTYKVGSVVTYDSIVYQSLQNANLNNNPSLAPSFWVPIQLSWVSTATYAINVNVVGSDGILYTSLQNANTGNTPASSPTWWVGTSAAAAASATAAAASASSASTSASNAATSATNAASSASSASTSATSATASAATATTQASNASTSASNAATSATNAASSATSASGSASAAATSATAAAVSASAAATSETNAATSATNAANSATSASTSATTATTQASNAATSATNAANSATSASTSATTATTQATNAASSATSAASSATSAATSATSAATSYDNFDDRYLGQKTSDPTVDNDGNPLLTGALYFNTVSNAMKVYNGSAWQDVAPVATTINLATQVTGVLPVANGGTGISSLGAGVATFLGTPSSANLAAAITDETGSGALVFATSPTLVTPNLGTPTALTLTSATGLPLTTGVTETLPIANGGTGQTTYTNGELLIGNTTGNTLTKATLTAGSGITVTNGGGSITIAALVSAAANSGSRIFLANSFGGF